MFNTNASLVTVITIAWFSVVAIIFTLRKQSLPHSDAEWQNTLDDTKKLNIPHTTKSYQTRYALRVHYDYEWFLNVDSEVDGINARCHFSKTRFTNDNDYVMTSNVYRQPSSTTIYLELESEINVGTDCMAFCNHRHFLWFHPNAHNFTLNYLGEELINAQLSRAKPPPCEKRLSRIAFSSSKCYPERMALIRSLVPEELVDYCGNCPYGRPSPFGCGGTWHKTSAFTEQYRFLLTLENTVCDNYLSEKFIRAFYDESIPILWDIEQHRKGFVLGDGQFFDLKKNPHSAKRLLREFVLSDNCTQEAPTSQDIRILSHLENICRYLEEIYESGNVSSQTPSCKGDCARQWNCYKYPSFHGE